MREWSIGVLVIGWAAGPWVAPGPAHAAAAAPGHASAAPVPAPVSPPDAAADTLPVARFGIPQAMLARKRGEILLVDVRSPGQRALGHIAGDAGLPIEQLASRHEQLPRSSRLVFYCSCLADEVALDAARLMIAAGVPGVAVLVGGFDAWRAAGGAVEVDATWDEIFRVDEPPAGWGKTPVDSLRCRYARDDRAAYRGAASGRIGCLADTSARGFAGFAQRLAGAPLRGRSVTFSAMVRAEGVAQFGFLWVGAEDAEGRMIAMMRADSPIKGTHDWQAAEASGTVPAGAARVLIGVNLAGAGRLWIDDVQLVAHEAPGLPRLRVVIANAGFEE